MQKKNPFLYFGEGRSYFEHYFQCCIWFEKELSAENQKKFLDALPFPTQIFNLQAFNSQIYFFCGEKDYEFTIKEMFDLEFKRLLELDSKGQSPIDIWGNEENFRPSPEEWKKFDKKITEWLLEIHLLFPIAFVFKSTTVPKKDDHCGTYGKWHTESSNKIFQTAVPYILEYFKNSSDNKILSQKVIWLSNELFKTTFTTSKKFKKINTEVLQIAAFSSLLCEHDGIMVLMRAYWRDQKPEEDVELILQIANLVLHLPEPKMFGFMRVEAVYLKYQQWGKLLELYANTSYLLRYNTPVEQVKDILNKVPHDFYLRNEAIKKITINVVNCKNTAEEMGFDHNLKEISEKIFELTKL